MSDFYLPKCCISRQAKIINDVAKVQIKSEKITPFGGIFHVREHFSQKQKLWSFTLSSAYFFVSFDFVFLLLTRDSSSKLGSPLARLLLTVVKSRLASPSSSAPRQYSSLTLLSACRRLHHSSLCCFTLTRKSARRQSKIPSKLIYRIYL